MKKASFLIALVLSLSSAAFASDGASQKKEEKQDLPKSELRHEMTVTAAPVLKAVKDCSMSVGVMDATDILAARPFNALGALTRLPGIFAHRTGDFGRTDVEIRGLGQRGQRLQILVDGRPEKMGIFGCAVTHAYPLDNVERIEVVRGPSSVLHGPDAMAGVVNIITHQPGPGFRTDLSASYGADDTMSLNFRHGAGIGKIDYFVTADRTTSDGHVPHSSYQGSSFTGRLGLDLGSGLILSLHSKYFDGMKNEPGPQAAPTLVSWNHYKRGSLDFSLDGKWDKSDLSLMAYGDFGRHLFSDGWNSRDHYSGLLGRMNLRISPSHLLSFGADARFLGGRSYGSPKGDWNKNDIGAYVHDELVLGGRWIISAGARVDRDSQFGWELSPQAGIVFRASDATSLRLSASKAFRTPHINELYLFPPSNPDLEPERVWNVEIGVDQSIGSGLVLTGSVFRMEGSNLIETVFVPGRVPPYQFRNTGAFTFYGAEVGLKAALSDSLSAAASYSHLDAGDLTRGRPGRKIDLDLRWRSGRFQVFGNAQSVSRYYAADRKALRIPSYFLLNGRVEASVIRGLSVFAEVNNITGADYLIYVDLSGSAAGLYSMPGRNVHVGFRTGF